MLKHLSRIYARRITNTSRPAELVVIDLELALEFIKINDLPRARQAICLLAEALDFRYELSQQFYNIYAIIDKKLAAGINNNDVSAVYDAKHLVSLLLEQWKDTARSDNGQYKHITHKPKITEGLTYNAAGLCEYAEQDYSGGYKV